MISSFLGLQTSLRGLLAQQQALDVAAHNVANANTVGYTRQEATLGAANPLHLTAGATQNGAGAFLGQGVDVTAYRRLRDSFLDLQVRAQSMALGDATHERRGARSRAERRRRAVDHRHQRPDGQVLHRVERPREPPRVRQLQAGRRLGRPDAGRRLRQARRRPHERRQRRQRRVHQHHRRHGPDQGGRHQPRAAQQGDRHRHRRRPEPQRPARPPRPDPRRPQPVRPGLGQPSSATAASRSCSATSRSSTTRPSDWQTPPPAGFAPGGGQLGALKTLATTTIPGYLASLDAVAKTLHDDVNAAYGSSFFTGDHRRHARHRHPRRLDDHRRLRQRGAGSNDLATAVAALRDTSAATASTAGSCARSARTPPARRTPSRSPRPPSTPPRIAARTSRASRSTRRWPTCCASSAATRPRPARCRPIDDMLDTLINRAGRVGL